jgi:hypothetical protein
MSSRSRLQIPDVTVPTVRNVPRASLGITSSFHVTGPIEWRRLRNVTCNGDVHMRLVLATILDLNTSVEEVIRAHVFKTTRLLRWITMAIHRSISGVVEPDKAVIWLCGDCGQRVLESRVKGNSDSRLRFICPTYHHVVAEWRDDRHQAEELAMYWKVVAHAKRLA